MPINGYFDTAFASSGSKVPVPDAIQTDGSVSYQQGYGPNYTLNPAVDPSALNIEQTKFNQLMFDITSAVRYAQQNGASPFITTTMNGGTPYSYAKGAIVSFDPGAGIQNYMSSVAANVTDPTDPSWIELGTAATSLIYNGGTTGGTANAQTASAAGFTLGANKVLIVKFGATNTSALTLNAQTTGVKNVYVPGPVGPVACIGGEAVSGNEGIIIYDGTQYQLINPSASSQQQPIQAAYKNLKVTWASNTTLTASADQLILQKTGSFPTYKASSVALTNTITSSGANGLDTGSIANNTWYFVYAIYNGTTVSSLVSASASSPTLPSGYTYYARIGSFITDGSAHIVGFSQKNSEFQYMVGSNLADPPLIASGAFGSFGPPVWVAQAVAGFMPTTAIKIKLAAFAGSGNMCVAANNNYDERNSGDPYTAGGNAGLFMEILLESTNFYAICDTGSGMLRCIGFTDTI